MSKRPASVVSSEEDLREQKRRRKAQYMREYRAARKLADQSRVDADQAKEKRDQHATYKRQYRVEQMNNVHTGTERQDPKQKRGQRADYMRNYWRKRKKKRVDAVRAGTIDPTNHQLQDGSGQDMSSTDRLQLLADSILEKIDIAEEDILLMTKDQNFTTDPRLALAYYYCCGGPPDAFVFNDEHVREAVSVKERLLRVIDPPPGSLEYKQCQTSSTATDPSNYSIFACASCCEFLVDSQSGHVCLPLALLPESFRVSTTEYTERYDCFACDLSLGFASKCVQNLLQHCIHIFIPPRPRAKDMCFYHLRGRLPQPQTFKMRVTRYHSNRNCLELLLCNRRLFRARHRSISRMNKGLLFDYISRYFLVRFLSTFFGNHFLSITYSQPKSQTI